MATENLLYRRDYPATDSISVVIPTVGQILDNEDLYNDVVSAFTAMPIDFMVQLDDAGIDFTTINAFDLFIMLSEGLKKVDTSLVLKDINLNEFELCVNNQTKKLVLYNQESGIEIGRREHSQIASTLRRINHLEKNRKKPGNDDAKQYMLERMRQKMKRHPRTEVSQLEQLIVAMVNTEQFKYDFESVRNITIYQFNECVRQIVNKVNYDNRMIGVYSGTVNVKELSQDELNWLVHK